MPINIQNEKLDIKRKQSLKLRKCIEKMNFTLDYSNLNLGNVW